MASRESSDAAIQTIIAENGRLDVIVHNALRGTHAAQAAISQAVGFLRDALRTKA